MTRARALGETTERPRYSLSPLAATAILWCLLTTFVVATSAGVLLWKGREGLAMFVQAGPLSNLHITLYSVAISWSLVGFVLIALNLRPVTPGNVLPLVCFLALGLLYVNVLRERAVYGDIQDYIQAAKSLSLGEHLNARYLYPPLWASLLEPLVPLGDTAIFDACWLFNLFSLFVFYFLLQRILLKYGFSSHLSVLVTFAFMVVNVPILRTLGYIQVNLHVTNLILLMILFYPRSRFLSALALALAVHLKISPAVMILPIVLNKDVRWFAWFSLCTLSIAAATIAANGLSPYQDMLVNLSNIYSTQGLNFRENSFDSLFRALAYILNSGDAPVGFLVAGSKLLLGLMVLVVGNRSVKNAVYYEGHDKSGVLYNFAPVLLIFMTMASPLVWTHHPVFLALSYLVVLKRLSSARDWTLFGLAYFLEFLVPTLDFFPWSYVRLLSPLMWLGVAWSLSEKQSPSSVFTRVNLWLTTILDPQTVVPRTSTNLPQEQLHSAQ